MKTHLRLKRVAPDHYRTGIALRQLLADSEGPYSRDDLEAIFAQTVREHASWELWSFISGRTVEEFNRQLQLSIDADRPVQSLTLIATLAGEVFRALAITASKVTPDDVLSSSPDPEQVARLRAVVKLVAAALGRVRELDGLSQKLKESSIEADEVQGDALGVVAEPVRRNVDPAIADLSLTSFGMVVSEELLKDMEDRRHLYVLVAQSLCAWFASRYAIQPSGSHTRIGRGVVVACLSPWLGALIDLQRGTINVGLAVGSTRPDLRRPLRHNFDCPLEPLLEFFKTVSPTGDVEGLPPPHLRQIFEGVRGPDSRRRRAEKVLDIVFGLLATVLDPMPCRMLDEPRTEEGLPSESLSY